MKGEPDRTCVWRSLGATPAEADELLAYAEDGFDRSVIDEHTAFPLDDEPFVAVWEDYIAESIAEGTVSALAKRLVQLSFPVEAGISESASYREATRRGVVLRSAGASSLSFRDPAGIRVFLHPTAAGRIPVIVARERSDFEALVRALTRRNEPDPIPPSMGACMVAGYNNWDRIARLRAEWAVKAGLGATNETWAVTFKSISDDKSRYQDRFILLSAGPYSATPAGALGVDETSWLTLSGIIRLEHECTHYFTRRVLGSMNNRLFDELLADYMGIVGATGRFRAEWFLRFLGLDVFPECRAGGRIENYRGVPPLSSGAFRVLQRAVVQAAWNLEHFDLALGGDREPLAERARTMLALAHVRLEELASADAPARLQAVHSRLCAVGV